VALGREAIRFEQGSAVMSRWFDVYAFPFGSPQSHCFAIQFKDISERKWRETDLQRYREELASANEELRASIEELSQANELLMRVNRDLDSFVYTASHDLKAPIANIHGLLRLLTKSLPPEILHSSANQKILGLMDESVARFTKTIAKLSDVVQLQKQAEQPTELVNLPDIIEEVRKDLNLAIEQSEAQILVDVNSCGSVEFAPQNLQSVIYNLLSNAIKYRHLQRKPVIRITCQALEGYYLLTVTDNGLGFSSHQQHRLFALFQRLHDHVEGTGIGLYMVKKIIENAGGKIEAESEVGVGSSFKVYFKR
jgi:signal transduction histidine kinase